MNFILFKSALSRQFDAMAQHDLFHVDIPDDNLWQTYLQSFPPGSDPIFRSRTEHDCSCCRHFIRNAGNIVSIIDNKLVSIWDITVPEPAYQTVADALSLLVKSYPILNVFRHFERTLGTDKNYEIMNGIATTWDHFYLQIPLRNDRSFIIAKPDLATKLGKIRSNYDVLYRSLTEITLASIETVVELIQQNSLYRGEEHKFVLTAFLELKQEFDNTAHEARALYCWSKLSSTLESVARIRNTAIGTLLVDLSAGVDLETAVKSFEAKVAPTNYKRPTALVTAAMVASARNTVAELGLITALDRRYATLSDININNTLFVNREPSARRSGDIFNDIPVKPRAIKNLDKLESIPIEKFITDLLPNITSIEVLFEQHHAPNLVSLIAPSERSAQNLFKWNNQFSWSYNGDVTDSIKERVKQAGGNITGDLCCRLAWHNYDDLDFHMSEPDSYEIYYANARRISPAGGMLDVDMNAGHGTTREPVENIFYSSRHTMHEGMYYLYVHQYQRREAANIGFEVEIDYLGTTYSFAHDRALAQHDQVLVARFKYSHQNGGEIIESLPVSHSSKSIWNVETNQFHKVNVLLMSPNFWHNPGIGNKHYFFMLANCQNAGQARGFYNEFLREELAPHRKVIELVGSKTKTEADQNQLSGLGFSSTQRNELVVRVNDARLLRITL